MNGPKLLVIVRHGESIRNKAKEGDLFFRDEETRDLVAGVVDYLVPINELGWQQSQQTGLALRKIFPKFDLIIHSGYLRTAQTVEAILEAYDKKIQVVSNLMIRERDPGFNFSMTEEDVKYYFPYHEEYWQLFGQFFSYPPGGEPIIKVCERVYVFLEMLKREHAGKRILVVTHGGTIRAFRFWLESWDYHYITTNYDLKAADNCAVFAYKYKPKKNQLVPIISNQIFWQI